ncbi:hypothetical protein NPA31_000985 [Aurantimonas sp. MSK8Z-1]|uniref:hypothetical protein n=1 Tax=Mangrovibrevibacter kandeliae TaxID=2968473 RepID=UPI00211855E6|nr:hypothetical protein [Aurantimonas sp. MSK8Z-1]MCW4113534.1 hypothetical protein [Aurantimonas sp. MSK8Z-1]
MLQNFGRHDAGEAVLDPFDAVEFELALDLQDPTQEDFETCVRRAAGVVGGEILFAVPSDATLEDATEIAAVRFSEIGPDDERQRILFAVLSGDGTVIRVADRSEIGERFYGFARAFVGVLERIRDTGSDAHLAPAGTA